MTLAQQTDVMSLDEPTSALDMGHQLEAMELVKSLTKTGKTVVLVLHDLAAVARYSDKIVAMKDGEIFSYGPPKEVVTAQLVNRLDGIDVGILAAPGDDAPEIVAKATNLTSLEQQNLKVS